MSRWIDVDVDADADTDADDALPSHARLIICISIHFPCPPSPTIHGSRHHPLALHRCHSTLSEPSLPPVSVSLVS